MKNKLIISVVFVTLSTLSVSSFAKRCVSRGVVSEMRIGYVDDNMKGGADNGDAIRVKFEGNRKVFVANTSHNLDNPSGKALFSLLTTAMLTGKPVDLWDHKGSGRGNCDDFDEVIIYNK